MLCTEDRESRTKSTALVRHQKSVVESADPNCLWPGAPAPRTASVIAAVIRAAESLSNWRASRSQLALSNSAGQLRRLFGACCGESCGSGKSSHFCVASRYRRARKPAPRPQFAVKARRAVRYSFSLLTRRSERKPGRTENAPGLTWFRLPSSPTLPPRTRDPLRAP